MDICIFIPVRMTALKQFWLIKPSHKTYPSVINKNKDCSFFANESHSGISYFSFLNQNMSLYPSLFRAALPCLAVFKAGRCALCWVPGILWEHRPESRPEMKNLIEHRGCQPMRPALSRGARPCQVLCSIGYHRLTEMGRCHEDVHQGTHTVFLCCHLLNCIF